MYDIHPGPALKGCGGGGGGGRKYNTPQSSDIVGTILNPSRKNMDLDRTPKKNEMFEGHRLKIKNDCWNVEKITKQ